MKYAATTSVSSDKSQGEIRKILARYGATKFGYMEEDRRAVIAFEIHGRRIRFVLPIPSRTDASIVKTSQNRTRSITVQHEVYEQAIRQRWRALTLAIKAKLETVESGIATFEEEFMAYVVLPSGKTVGEWMQPQIEQAYESGKMPPLMLGAGESVNRGRYEALDDLARQSRPAVMRWRQDRRGRL